ncbi:MAG TPA: FliH/SctL family protein [Acidobacteriaceae bacterium]|jgi:flagellar assembly protein FliH|nr:FliH/SctL family protein [Acidobacteriaceae bacterium]
MLGNTEAQVRAMQYPVLAGGTLTGSDCATQADLAARVCELEAAMAQREKQYALQLEAMRREGQEKGRAAALGEQAAWRRQMEGALAGGLEELCARREEYLARVEQEVVRLALAIAERILHREAQMDPLLLAGAVRVALGQLAESTEVRLRVPPEQLEMWVEMLRLMPGLPLRPEVVGDAGLGAAEAVLEAGLGTVDLGVRGQIAEIERGFFDLLEARREPGRSSGSGKKD